MSRLVFDAISRFEYLDSKSGRTKIVKSDKLTDLVNYVYKAHTVDKVEYVKTPIQYEQKLIDLMKGEAPPCTQFEVFELYVLYPYRARAPQEFRKQELQVHKDYLTDYLVKNFPRLKFNFVVVEQNNDLPFNKGRLLNIGFLKGLEEHKKQDKQTIPYFCIHNTDIFPIENVDYSFSNGLRDIQGYTGGVGGLTLLDYQSFLRFNGYPNNFFGWGGEDICVKERAEDLGIPIDRSCHNNKGKSIVKESDHYRDSSQNTRNLELYRQDKASKGYQHNGVRQTKFDVVQSNVINARNTLTYYLLVDFRAE